MIATNAVPPEYMLVGSTFSLRNTMDDKAKIVARARWLDRLATGDRFLLGGVLGLPVLSGALLLAQAAVLAARALLGVIIIVRVGLSALG